jgi:hypothetical protein
MTKKERQRTLILEQTEEVDPLLGTIAHVFLLHFGLVPIVISNKFGLVGAVWAAMLPGSLCHKRNVP